MSRGIYSTGTKATGPSDNSDRAVAQDTYEVVPILKFNELSGRRTVLRLFRSVPYIANRRCCAEISSRISQAAYKKFTRQSCRSIAIDALASLSFQSP